MILFPEQQDFLRRAFRAAIEAPHIFPDMAACEAALESGYGSSLLATRDNNLFGMKQHQHPVYGTHSLPTKEFLGNRWVTVSANWVVYPDWSTCFADRMATLRRLAKATRTTGALVYPHYAAALAALSGTSYIEQVSLTWSTDPERSRKVLAIYEHLANDANANDGRAT